MSEEGTGGTLVSRRSFLKTTGLAAGATALACGAQPVLRTLAADYVPGQAGAEGEQIVNCVCRPNCVGFCRHNVHVRDGRVVKTSMAPFPDAKYNRICLRGLSHVQRIYDPDRIKYPMKRAGERGENKWERITWDEAITEITDKFKSIQDEYGKQAVAFFTMSGNHSLLNGTLPGLGSRFQNLIGGTAIDVCTDSALQVGYCRVVSYAPTDLNTCNEPADWANSRVILLWGYNLTEANIHNWHFVADAMESGAKLIVIDPVYTHAASKADMYVPCRPGSDPALIMSMIHVILSEKLYNEEYVTAHTVAPFLVREDSGLFLRMSDLGVTPAEGPPDAQGQPTYIDPAAVWDLSTGTAVAVGSVQAPAIEGTFMVNGVKVRTAFDLLKEEAAKYTPEEASKLTDVASDTIRELAVLASGEKVANLGGFGSQSYTNGVMCGHALATLAGITGNIGVSGGTSGYLWQFYPGIDWYFTFPTFEFGPKVPTLVFQDVVRSGEYKGQPFPVKALHVSHANPFSNMVDQNVWLNETLPGLELVVVRDMVFSDTARYADYLLPVPHWYETEEISHVGGQHPYIQHSAKAIDPLFEAKSDADIYRLLADKMGIGEYFSKTDAEYIDEILATPLSEQMGISYASLKEQGVIRYLPDPYIAFENAAFLTPSGRLEFYVEKPMTRMDYGQTIDVEREHLPRFYPPAEAWPDNELYGKYPLVLMSERPRFRVHTQWWGVPWLRELEPEPILKINSSDAAARDIANGDYVEVFNDRGHAVAKAVVTEGIRPGAMTYPKGWQKSQHVAGSFSELTSSRHDPVGVNSSFFDVLADVRKWNGQV